MDAPSLTRAFIYAVAAAVILYDVAVVILCGPRASVSVVLYEESRRYPIVPILLGLAIGHVFWPHYAD